MYVVPLCCLKNYTGAVIKELREKRNLTQSVLATKLNVSDKTVSKWGTGKGYPDISLLELIAGVFCVSVSELLSGNAITNMNVSANMLRSKFYVCPICGNVIHSMGEMVISCHGIQLIPVEVELLYFICRSFIILWNANCKTVSKRKGEY